MSNTLIRVALLSLAVLCGGDDGASFAQTNAPKAAPATISGRVTSGDNKGVAGVSVTLNVSDSRNNQSPRHVARTKTDAEGRYTLENISPGRYQIASIAPAFVTQDAGRWWSGKPLEVLAGETIEDINFKLERGGVITGRVTDADGKPVIGEFITISPDDQSKRENFRLANPAAYQTDDRGIYRIYALPAGNYRVSVGQGMARGGGARRVYQRTFYPGTSEMSEARLVEVTAGGETTEIDITLGSPMKTFKATGHVVNAETGQVVPGMRIVITSFRSGSTVGNDRNSPVIGNAAISSGTPSNARGEFEIGSLLSGHYVISAILPENTSELYGDTASFDIGDADVSGLEVKMRRGGSVSGIVEIEGVRDRVLLARLMSQIWIVCYPEGRNAMSAPGWRTAHPAPDGTFRLDGIRPGKAHIDARAESDLSLLRIEGEGVEPHGEIMMAESAQMSGVRVVMRYGSGVVRGQVNITGGTLPPDAYMVAFARHVGGDTNAGRPAEIDARGYFRIEGLAAGDYEIYFQANAPRRRTQQAKAFASVTEGGETTITLVLDLSEWK